MAQTPFLTDWHGRFGLSRSQVVAIAERATGHAVESIERLARGYDNEVHRVILSDDRTVYVRIRRRGEGSVEQEARAMALARSGGVRVPAVLAVDPACDDADGHPVMVVTAAPGRPLADVLDGVSVSDRRQLLSGVGTELARLHLIDLPGVWRPGDDGAWPDPDQARQGFAAERRAEREQLLEAGLTPVEVDRVIDLLLVSPDPPTSGFVLCHGDVSAEHVFVDAHGQVSCLIDWGMWHAGSRGGELAYVAHTFGWNDLPAILRGYGRSPAGDDEALPELATISAVQLIGHIAHHVRIGDVDGAARTVSAVRQAFRVLDDDFD